MDRCSGADRQKFQPWIIYGSCVHQWRKRDRNDQSWNKDFRRWKDCLAVIWQRRKTDSCDPESRDYKRDFWCHSKGWKQFHLTENRVWHKGKWDNKNRWQWRSDILCLWWPESCNRDHTGRTEDKSFLSGEFRRINDNKRYRCEWTCQAGNSQCIRISDNNIGSWRRQWIHYNKVYLWWPWK